MSNRPALIGRQRGVAVIIALLLTTLAITIVASLFWQQQVQVRSIENQRLQLQTQWILRGALDWAELILREDAKYSSVDTLDEPWAVPLAETRLDQYVDSGKVDADIATATLSGNISDAQARYNLTNLSSNGIVDQNEIADFAQLLANEHLDPALARITAGMMAAAQQASSSNPTNTDTQTAPLPANFEYVNDLLSVPGFTPAMLDKIRNYVIFLPRNTPINVNTAPAQVLTAKIDGLTLADATALVASRSNASFRSIADFSLLLPQTSLSVSNLEASVTSNYFLVNGKVHLGRAELQSQALVERNGASIRLVWIREY